MKTNSVVAVVVSVLLSACCMLCPIKADPSIDLHKYLDSKVKAGQGLDAALTNYLGRQNLTPDNRNFAEQIEQLLSGGEDTERVCTAKNIATLRELVTKTHSKATRVSSLLLSRTAVASALCFEVFESQWQAQKQNIETNFETEVGKFLLDYVDTANKKDHELLKGERHADGEFKNLQVALLDYFDTPLDSDEEKLGWLAKTVNLLKRNSSKGAELQGSGGQTLSDAKEFIEQRFLEPCRYLADQEESKSILEPVGQLADISNLVELSAHSESIKPHKEISYSIESVRLSSILWASRYFRCKSYLRADMSGFAKKILQQSQSGESKKAMEKLQKKLASMRN